MYALTVCRTNDVVFIYLRHRPQPRKHANFKVGLDYWRAEGAVLDCINQLSVHFPKRNRREWIMRAYTMMPKTSNPRHYIGLIRPVCIKPGLLETKYTEEEYPRMTWSEAFELFIPFVRMHVTSTTERKNP